MLLSVFLTCFAALVLTTALLLVLGHRIRFSSRILGALLPDPSAAFNHPFGVADYAVTYWGYQLLANLLDASERLR